jgi:hypothetical protein
MSVPLIKLKLTVKPASPLENTEVGPPLTASVEAIVSSIRNNVLCSRKERVSVP